MSTKQRSDYKVCGHCGKKGAYLYTPMADGQRTGVSQSFCRYCRPRKAWMNLPTGLPEPRREESRSPFSRLFGFLRR